MKKEEKNLSRRNFLVAGSTIVASSVLATETNAAPSSKESALNKTTTTRPLMPTFEDDVRATPLTGLGTGSATPIAATDTVLEAFEKTKFQLGTLGTEYVNIKDYPNFATYAPDITLALNWALDQLDSSTSSKGGKVLIPQGVWTSNGGHYIEDSISVEGIGIHYNHSGLGTEIVMNSASTNTSMFRIGATFAGAPKLRKNCSIKNLVVDMQNKPTAIGLHLVNSEDPDEGGIYGTHLENVMFFGGAYGIKVDSTSGAYECINCVFDRVTLSSTIGFYCNTPNSGFIFNTPYVVLGENTTGFHCVTLGSLTINNHNAIGSQSPRGTNGADDCSTFLYTVGAFNTIEISGGGQDENIEFFYRNSTYDYVSHPIVIRDCLIQSKIHPTSDISFVLDSNKFLNSVEIRDDKDDLVAAAGGGLILDHGIAGTDGCVPSSSESNLIVHLVGRNVVETYDWEGASPLPALVGSVLTDFTSQFSYVIDPGGNIVASDGTTPLKSNGGFNKTWVNTLTSGYRVVNASSGSVVIPTGQSSLTVYDNVVQSTTANISAMLLTHDTGRQVEAVVPNTGYFTIYLSATASINVTVAFNVVTFT